MNELLLKESSEVLITQEQLAIIKNTICKDASFAEMQLFFYDCKRRGVHPLDRMIHFTKRSGRYVPITSIDFFYQRAHATEQFAGQDTTVFDGDPGTPVFKATVTVYRQRPGMAKAGWTATARWKEYYPGDQQGHMWKKMEHRMLEKCAEALALRKAFPAELHGLYVKEEMVQMESDLSETVEQDGAVGKLEKVPDEKVENMPASIMTAGNTCQQLRLCEDFREMAAIMNQWLAEQHQPEDMEQVNKALAETKKRLGGKK